MNKKDLDDIYNEIGNNLFRLANGDYKKILMYICPFEGGGAMSIAIFVEKKGGKVFFHYGAGAIAELCYKVTEKMREMGSQFSMMIYSLIEENVKIDFIYPEQFDSSKNEEEIRDEFVQNNFGNIEITYPAF